MEWLIGGLTLLGMAIAAVIGFIAGRVTASPNPPTATAPLLTEAEKKKQRELQNFLQYDGFSQP